MWLRYGGTKSAYRNEKKMKKINQLSTYKNYWRVAYDPVPTTRIYMGWVPIDKEYNPEGGEGV